MTDLPDERQDVAQLARSRKAARRTAWLFAGIAAAVYAGFLLLGVMSK